MGLVFTVPANYLLKSNGGQGNRYANASKVKHLRSMAYLIAVNALNKHDIDPVLTPVHVTVTVRLPHKAARFDPPNYYPTVKPLIDGMTDAGVWADDNSTIIPVFSFQAGKPTGVKSVWAFDITWQIFESEQKK